MNMSSIWISCFIVMLAVKQISGFNAMKNFKPDETIVKPDDKWIVQKIDHFNPVDNRIWNMRYFSESQFHKNGGPMFIFIGGEWSINEDIGHFLLGGPMFDLARKHNAHMFYTEHRFYGDSIPFKKLDKRNFQYFSIDQALEDLAYFIDYMKINTDGLKNSKVVVFGCSYSAMLASWARMKYPHLVDAAYASSPVFALEVGVPKYLEVMNDQIGKISSECLKTYQDGFHELTEYLNSSTGIDYLSKLFNTCTKINPNQPYLAYFVRTFLVSVIPDVQTAGIKAIIETCNQLMKHNGKPLEKIAALANKNLNETCRTLPTTTPLFEVSWLYQLCTQIGAYQTSTSDKQIFGNLIPLAVFYETCSNVFGSSLTPDVINEGVARTKLVYGNSQRKMENVVFYSGGVDPWHLYGPTKNLSDLAPVYFVEKTAHCSDFQFSEEETPYELKIAKRLMQEVISDWIQ